MLRSDPYLSSVTPILSSRLSSWKARRNRPLVFGDNAKEAVRFVGDSSREKDSARLREKIPQALKLEGCSIGAHQRLDKIAADRIVIVDATVAEIADPQPVLHESKSPWGIELTV